MKKMIHSPHDRFFRQAMSDRRVAKEFFDYHLSSAIRDRVNLEELQLQKESFVDEHLKLAVTDMLFSTSFAEQPGYLYVLVEHQSQPDKLMPFRLLKYMVAIMDQHLKNNPSSHLPLVYPVLFYTGEKAYPYSTDLFDLFAEPQSLTKQIFLQPFQLIDITQISDEDLKQRVWLGVMELCFKHIFARDILPYLQDMVSLLQAVENAGGSQYIQAALTYLLMAGEMTQTEQFIETIQRHLSPETGATIMTIAQQLEAKGIEKGIEKGRAEGEAIGVKKGQLKTQKFIARNLLQKGLAVEAVAQITDLSIDEVQALQDQAH